jgi:protocatechuate 3,4-dioxygenase beta subunit
MVVLMGEVEQTQGPFAEQEDDYVWTSNDLTLAGKVGAPGIVGEDRVSVVQGVPLDLTLTVYDMTTGMEQSNVQVFLWHTDASGMYSAVDDPNESTEVLQMAGQVWCRGVQTTNATGQVSFRTILPGWYQGRAIHYHVRLRFPGTKFFAATSQLYLGNSDLALFQTREPYASNRQPITLLEDDGIFARFDETIQDLLTLKLQGSVDTGGFTSSLQLGLLPDDYSRFQGDGAGGPAEADGMGPAGENVVLEVVPQEEEEEPTDVPTQSETNTPTVAPTTVLPTNVPTQLQTVPPTVTAPTEAGIPNLDPTTTIPPLEPVGSPPTTLAPGPEGTFPITAVEDLINMGNNSSTTNSTLLEPDTEVEKGMTEEKIEDESILGKGDVNTAISYAPPSHTSLYLVVVLMSVVVLLPSWIMV